MPVEHGGSQTLQRTRSAPRPLIVGVEDLPLVIETDAAGRANAAGRWNGFAVGRDPQTPAAIFAVTVERTGQAQHDPNVAFLVELRAESVLVVIAVDAPGIADCLDHIGPAVAVFIAQPRNFRPMRRV